MSVAETPPDDPPAVHCWFDRVDGKTLGFCLHEGFWFDAEDFCKLGRGKDLASLLSGLPKQDRVMYRPLGRVNQSPRVFVSIAGIMWMFRRRPRGKALAVSTASRIMTLTGPILMAMGKPSVSEERAQSIIDKKLAEMFGSMDEQGRRGFVLREAIHSPMGFSNSN